MVVIDTINLKGVELIQFVQEKLPNSGQFFLSVSDYGDPTLMCSLYFPLATALSPVLGVNLIWTFVFCEWMNMILKLLLAGDRPFWWVHESPLFRNKRPPYIHQFSRTCETGAGNPSGHTMLNAAITLVFVLCIINKIKKSSLISKTRRNLLVKAVWTFYVIWLVMVCTSRIYIAAHFPHQCVSGVVLGIFTVFFVRRTTVLLTPSRKQVIALTSAILITVLSVFGLYNRILGFDPMWSLEKAIKWCIKREYIHVDSTPFYSLTRYSGMSFGAGLALSSHYYIKTFTSRFSKLMTLSSVILSICVSQFGAFMHNHVLNQSMRGYYVMEFLLNTSVTLVYVALIPYCVARISGQMPGSKYKKPH